MSKRGESGDPLSPLLFYIIEYMLNIGLSKLVVADKIKKIKASRKMAVPTHRLYADDIMLFTKGNLSSFDAISNLYRQYVECSG